MSKEAAIRQQHEYTIMHLRQHITTMKQENPSAVKYAPLSNDEIDRAARIRVELERTCKELKTYRDTLADDIASLAEKHQQAGLAAERYVKIKPKKKKRNLCEF